MIKQEDFYSKNEYPDFKSKMSIWKNVKNAIPRETKKPVLNLEYKSFAFGFAAAFTFLFVCIGIYSVVTKLSEKSEPDYIRVNKAYTRAIDEFEQTMPKIVTASNKSFNLDEMLKARNANLKNIDAGIQEIKMDAGDLSPIKQNRLRQLYKMKLDILSKMIDAEENGL